MDYEVCAEDFDFYCDCGLSLRPAFYPCVQKAVEQVVIYFLDFLSFLIDGATFHVSGSTWVILDY